MHCTAHGLKVLAESACRHKDMMLTGGAAEFERWKRDHTKACPSCGVAIEKSMGCNHMTCSKCKGHFCWICGEGFESQTSTHDHLVARHGGIFDANTLY